MAIERTEQVGLGVAATAHIALIVLLSINWPDPPPLPIENPPMAVDLIAEAAPVSTSPEPASEAPAAHRGEMESDTVAPPPAPPVPKVLPRVVPPPPQPKKAIPAPAPRPTPRAERRPPPPPARDTSERRRPDRPTATPPRQTAPARPTTPPQRNPRPAAGDPLGDIANSVARSSTPNARGTAAPAAQTASEIRRSISTSINAEVARPWNACRVTGIDVDQLKTTVVFRLTQSGGLERIASVNTSGVNDTNRTQLSRFEECARRAIELAAPFNLPAESYSYWQTYTLDFEKRAR